MTIRLALRSITRNRRRSLMTLLVIVFGAVGLILFGGYKAITFRGLRESTIRGRIGHLQIYGPGYLTKEAQRPLEHALTDAAAIRRIVERDPRVKLTAAQISLNGLVSNGEKSETFLATAVEPERDAQFSAQKLVSGTDLPRDEPDTVLLGRGLAASMHAKPGDWVTLMSMTTAGSLNAIDVRVAGVFMTGVKEYDERAVKMPIAAAQQLLQTTKVEKLLVLLHETSDTEAVHASLARDLAKYRVEFREWQQLASFYHQVVALYNGIFGFLGIVVFCVVIFSVANTVTMSVLERTREIGTLMAIGTSRGRIWRSFLAEGVVLGLLGGTCGLAAGALLAYAINGAHVMLPPPPGYTSGYRLQILLVPQNLAFVFVISFFTAALSSVLPAWRASRLKIVDALGHI